MTGRQSRRIDSLWDWPRQAAAPLVRFAESLAPDKGVAAGSFALARGEVRQVLLLSGLIGFYLGMGTGWQVNIESAQVVAGIVKYPVDNPFAMYHLKTWTLLHQVPAALLAIGAPERVLAMIVAGLAGMISFQALALAALAVGASRLLSVMTPLVLLGCEVYYQIGSIYPVRVLSNAPWVLYGCVGTSLALLVWGLIAVGWTRTGALLMGLAPAIHPTMGAWCLLFGSLAFVWNWRREWSVLRRSACYMAVGFSITCLSLAIHLYLCRHVPDIPAEWKAQYIATFAANWDSHRKPFPMDHVVVLMAALTLVLCGVWLRWFSDRLPHSSRFFLCSLLTSAVVSILLCVSTQWQEHLPMRLTMAMPGRYINVTGLAFPALCLGMLYRNRPSLVCHLTLVGLVVYLMLVVQVYHVGWVYAPPPARLFIGCALMLLSQTSFLSTSQPWRSSDGWLLPALPWLARAALLALAINATLDVSRLALVLWILVAMALLGNRLDRVLSARWLVGSLEAAIAVAAWLAAICLFDEDRFFAKTMTVGMLTLTIFHHRQAVAALFERLHIGQACRSAALTVAAGSGVMMLFAIVNQVVMSYPKMSDWHDNIVYALAHRGSGLLLTGSDLRATQLRTRRPVLLEGPALNQLPYVPQSGPAMNHILKQVYGEDLFRQRPPTWRRGGGLHRDTARALWQAREVRQWQKLAREFGFTQIMTSNHWKLKLPIIGRSQRLLLYEVPGASAPPSSPVAEFARIPPPHQ